MAIKFALVFVVLTVFFSVGITAPGYLHSSLPLPVATSYSNRYDYAVPIVKTYNPGYYNQYGYPSSPLYHTYGSYE